MENSPLFAEYPELASLSRDDLQDMLADPSYFHAVFHSLPRVKALFQAQSELGAANEAIAKKNLTLQDSLYKLRSETQDAFNEAKALQARQKELEREQKDLYQRYLSSFLSLRLRHATTAQDDESERLASAFIRSTPSSGGASNVAGPSGNGVDKEVDDFVTQFRYHRKTYHKRAMWGEKWSNGKVDWPEE